MRIDLFTTNEISGARTIARVTETVNEGIYEISRTITYVLIDYLADDKNVFINQYGVRADVVGNTIGASMIANGTPLDNPSAHVYGFVIQGLRA